jgi:dCTP deaminase
MSEPWKNWIPGVLSKNQVKELCGQYIENVTEPEKAIGYSSIDLTLSDEGYEMLSGSIKPAGIEYRRTILENPDYAKKLPDGQVGIFNLSKGKTYVFHLNEKIDKLRKTSIYGQATAKSSIGRVDVLARLIVDGMYHYEYFDPEKLSERHVEMFLEISPITFDVRVKEGISLSQLRLFYGHPRDSQKRGKELCKSLLFHEEGPVEDPMISVDLSETQICSTGVSASAFGAKKQENPIDLWKHEKEADRPDPVDYWECLQVDERKRLFIEETRFYIIRSKERLCLPKGIAVYARAIDETIGEMRVHYAGFAHPFFGKDRRDGEKGTPLMFEVREHSFPVSLRDEEKLARLEFYRMSEDYEQPKSNDRREGENDEDDDYNEQELLLSKLFSPWRS